MIKINSNDSETFTTKCLDHGYCPNNKSSRKWMALGVKMDDKNFLHWLKTVHFHTFVTFTLDLTSNNLIKSIFRYVYPGCE